MTERVSTRPLQYDQPSAPRIISGPTHVICGIDPGQKGGIAFLGHDGGLAAMHRLPMLQVHGKKILDVRWLDQALGAKAYTIDAVVIERVHAMPKQGVSSSFQFGRQLGAVETWAYTNARRVEYALPSVWKSAYGITSKQQSLDAALQRFGEFEEFRHKANEALAEAALIALWGMRHLHLVANQSPSQSSCGPAEAVS